MLLVPYAKAYESALRNSPTQGPYTSALRHSLRKLPTQVPYTIAYASSLHKCLTPSPTQAAYAVVSVYISHWCVCVALQFTTKMLI